ncbi:hypothetical protein LLH00_08970 [bacterium]|nr:hypothetical protein [bacterium]
MHAILLVMLLGGFFRNAAGAEGAARGLARGLARLGLTPNEIYPSLNPSTEISLGSTRIDGVPRQDLARGLGNILRAAAELDSCRGAMDFLAWMCRESGITPQAAAVSTPPEELISAADSLDRLLPGVGAGRSLGLLWSARCCVDLALDSLSAAEVHELDSLVHSFPLEADQWPHFPAERMTRLARRADLGALAAALACLDSAAALWRAVPLSAWRGRGKLSLDTPLGQVVLLGEGADNYHGAPLLLVDFGGADSLILEPMQPGAAGLVLDREGDDFWCAGHGFGGAACLSALWLEDCGGDDSWDCDSCGLGFAACGAAVLVERGGDDTYRAGCASQGAALFGLSLMLDATGDDSMNVGILGQGALLGGGTALLADLEGNDFRAAGGRVPDWRDPGATRSQAQGASLGLRPFAGGGVACLYDRAGDDRCRADCFAQGAGYWGGVGLLVDAAGRDSYTAGRYAQGVGLHFAAGCILEAAGDDNYSLARGVGQGAGEDRALGILVESGGNDSYGGGWMARGAGGTGGVGLLLELNGNDSYTSGPKLSGGAGNRWRELAGLGFLIDCAGLDSLDSAPSDSTTVRSGTWGARVDLEGAADANKK